MLGRIETTGTSSSRWSRKARAPGAPSFWSGLAPLAPCSSQLADESKDNGVHLWACTEDPRGLPCNSRGLC